MPILKKDLGESGYTLIPNELLRNKELSLPAKGLLCFMLSCADDWKFSIKGLSSVLNTSEHLIGKYLTELSDLGYHKKEAIREGGKIVEWKYFVSDSPVYTESEETPKEPKQKKKNLFQQCCDVIDAEFVDQDVKDALKEYLTFRVKEGRLSAKSWATIAKELRTLANNKDMALKIIRQATERRWMKFYPYSQTYRRKGFVDDIQKTEDPEQAMKDEYFKQFGALPKCDRPTYDEWKEGKCDGIH